MDTSDLYLCSISFYLPMQRDTCYYKHTKYGMKMLYFIRRKQLLILKTKSLEMGIAICWENVQTVVHTP